MQISHSPHRQGRPPNNRREAALGTASEMEEVTSDSPPKVIERIHACAEGLLALQLASEVGCVHAYAPKLQWPIGARCSCPCWLARAADMRILLTP